MRFWLLALLWILTVVLGVVLFCQYAPACPVKPKSAPAPTIKMGQPSRVLVRLGTPYRAEYHKPKMKTVPPPKSALKAK